jgi:hypothetical protein
MVHDDISAPELCVESVMEMVIYSRDNIGKYNAAMV